MSSSIMLRDDRDDDLTREERERRDEWPTQADVSDAFLDFERARGDSPDSPEVYFNFGMRALEFGPGSEVESHAVDAFERYTQLRPREATGFYHLGLALMYAGRYDEALKAYETALELEPNSPDVIMGLLYTNTALEDYSLAHAYTERLLDISRSGGNGVILDARVFYCWYGVTLLMNGQLDEAEEYFGRALEAAGEPSSFGDLAHYGLGVVELRRGNQEGARGQLEAIRKRSGTLYASLLRAVEEGRLETQEMLAAIIGKEA